MPKQRILDTGNTIALERPSINVPRNSFNHSHPVKISGNIGGLYPVLMQEVIPGDTFHITSEIMARMQPMVAPVFQQYKMRVDFFNVDNILLWKNFYQFISPLQEGDVPPAAPFIGGDSPTNNFVHKSVADYLGVPTAPLGTNNSPKVSALPFAAYNKVICDWYSDEDLQSGGKDAAFGLPLMDGDNNANFNILNQSTVFVRNNDRGYLTSAKPWAQKGDPVVIPLISSADSFMPVSYLGGGGPARFQTATGTAAVTGPIDLVNASGDSAQIAQTGGALLNFDPAGTLGITQSDAMQFAGTINDLRAAEALQSFLEAELIGGTRYPELMKTMFDVSTDDRRMFRAEFLGSYSQNMSISEVLNTTGTATAAQGTMAGHGIAVAKHPDGIHHTCKEHGWIVGILSVIPAQPIYYQGVRKEFLRFDRLDYLWPMLAQLGSQTIENQEVYYNEGASGNTGVFGYIPRYTEYRMTNGKVCGDFRTSLDYWQGDIKLNSLPTLSGTFLAYNANQDRIFADINVADDHMLFYIYHQITVERALPRLAVPNI
jgi:hypothetical protein